MGVETRKGRPYLYRRRRVGGRLRAEYLGPVSADLAEYYRWKAIDAAASRAAEREGLAAAARDADAVLAATAEFDQLADRVFRVVMYLTGHRLHNRGEWRRKFGDRTMPDMSALFAPPGPKPPIVTPWIPNKEKQRVLDQAASGDVKALPAVRELLKDPSITDQIGSVAGLAKYALIATAAGEHLAVAEAIDRKYQEYIDRLLADGGPDPSYAEQMAATRAAHNWLAVHTLECMAATHPAAGPKAAAIDRRVSVAERRLHAALKSLALLRRLRKPVLVAQVNMANGPMLVDNRTGGAAGEVRGGAGEGGQR
jgi:hypothetical protein